MAMRGDAGGRPGPRPDGPRGQHAPPSRRQVGHAVTLTA